MPMLSYVHQLFNADQCHAYIHTLRWKDRPLWYPLKVGHFIPTVCLEVMSLMTSSCG